MTYGSEEDLIFDVRNGLAEVIEATGQCKLFADDGRQVAARLVRLLKSAGLVDSVNTTAAGRALRTLRAISRFAIAEECRWGYRFCEFVSFSLERKLAYFLPIGINIKDLKSFSCSPFASFETAP